MMRANNTVRAVIESLRAALLPAATLLPSVAHALRRLVYTLGVTTHCIVDPTSPPARPVLASFAVSSAQACPSAPTPCDDHQPRRTAPRHRVCECAQGAGTRQKEWTGGEGGVVW